MRAFSGASRDIVEQGMAQSGEINADLVQTEPSGRGVHLAVGHTLAMDAIADDG